MSFAKYKKQGFFSTLYSKNHRSDFNDLSSIRFGSHSSRAPRWPILDAGVSWLWIVGAVKLDIKMNAEH